MQKSLQYWQPKDLSVTRSLQKCKSSLRILPPQGYFAPGDTNVGIRPPTGATGIMPSADSEYALPPRAQFFYHVIALHSLFLRLYCAKRAEAAFEVLGAVPHEKRGQLRIQVLARPGLWHTDNPRRLFSQ